jgi:hypothetical protein
MAEVTLRRGGLELVLAPEQGGCVQAFRRGAFDVLHASQAELQPWPWIEWGSGG